MHRATCVCVCTADHTENMGAAPHPFEVDTTFFLSHQRLDVLIGARNLAKGFASIMVKVLQWYRQLSPVSAFGTFDIC